MSETAVYVAPAVAVAAARAVWDRSGSAAGPLGHEDRFDMRIDL